MEKVTKESGVKPTIIKSHIYSWDSVLMGKKVLIISPFNPGGVGGAETFVKDIMRKIKAEYKNVGLATMHKFYKDWDSPSMSECLEIAIILLVRSFKIRRYWKYETVHCIGIIATAVGAILKLMFKVRLVSTTLANHDTGSWSPWRRKIGSCIMNAADRVFVEDNFGRDDMLDLRVSFNRIKKFMHWVDLERFKPRDHKTEKFHVLFVGRPIYKKGKDIVEDVERHFKRNKLKAVFTYVENVPYKDLPEYYRNADVVVIPSRYNEGVTRVALEAAASGCAVISSAYGSLKELVKPFGIVSHNEENFKFHLLELYSDRSLLAGYKQTSRVYAMAHFSDKNAEVFLNEY